MKRKLIAFAAIITCAGTIAQAQLTSNPATQSFTNLTAIVPIGPYGFGLALLGYPTPPNPATFFARGVDTVTASDSTDVAGTNKFYVSAPSFQGGQQGDINAFIVSFANTNRLVLQVIRNRFAQANSGNPGSISFCPSGLNKSGLSAFTTDITGADLWVVDVNTNTPALPGAPPTIGVSPPSPPQNLFGTANNIYPPALGENSNLVVFTIGNASQWLTRYGAGFSISSTEDPASGVKFGTSTVLQSAISFNDAAGIAAVALSSGVPDVSTALTVYVVSDLGGTSVSVLSSNTYSFGDVNTNTTPSTVTTNFINWFNATPFRGPPQISINDRGDLVLPVGINEINTGTGGAGSDPSNGTRNARMTGILFKPHGSSQFLKVVDNQDASLFYIPSDTCTNRNNFSNAAVDNFCNVYFEAAYATDTSFPPCPLVNFLSNAVYEAVANDPTNPTSWTTRILVKAGDSYVNTVGQTIRINSLNIQTTQTSTHRLSISDTGLSPVSINRTQVSGFTPANTAPSSPFAFGGVAFAANLTNITAGFNFSGVMLVAPYANPCTPLPFLITSITRSGNDINLSYNAQTGTNIVQVSTGAVSPAGSYNGSFTDLTTSTNIVTGCPASANFTEVGGGGNTPSRYYRVRLIQP